MVREVEILDPELLLEANALVVESRGSPDAVKLLLRHFDQRIPPTTLAAIQYRMVALSNMIGSGEVGTPWIFPHETEDYQIISEAAFSAAAITPLSVGEGQDLDTLQFESELFFANALFALDASGNA